MGCSLQWILTDITAIIVVLRFFRKEQNSKSGQSRTYMYVKSAIYNDKTRGFVTVIINGSGRDTEQS